MKKLLYFCSFVPYLTLKDLGFDMVSVYDQSAVFTNNPRLSGHLCSFTRHCETIDFARFDGAVFTNCCNSMQRLYDFVKFNHPQRFTFLLEISHTEKLIYNLDDLMAGLSGHFKLPEKISYHKMNQEKMPQSDILVIASSLHQRYIDRLTGLFSNYRLSFETCQHSARGDTILNQIKDVSCPRMTDFFEYVKTMVSDVKAVICIITQKCDHMMFSYPQIKKMCAQSNKKCLVLEEEFVDKLSQRSKLRYEAFQESLYLTEYE